MQKARLRTAASRPYQPKDAGVSGPVSTPTVDTPPQVSEGESDWDDFDDANDIYYTFRGYDDEAPAARPRSAAGARQARQPSPAAPEADAEAPSRSSPGSSASASKQVSPGSSHAGTGQLGAASQAIVAAVKMLKLQQGKDLTPDDPHLQPHSAAHYAHSSHATRYESKAAQEARAAAAMAIQTKKPRSAIRAMALSSFRSHRRRLSVNSTGSHGTDASFDAAEATGSGKPNANGGLVAQAMQVAGSAAAARAKLHAAVAAAERRSSRRALLRGGLPEEDFRPIRRRRCVSFCLLHCTQCAVGCRCVSPLFGVGVQSVQPGCCGCATVSPFDGVHRPHGHVLLLPCLCGLG